VIILVYYLYFSDLKSIRYEFSKFADISRISINRYDTFCTEANLDLDTDQWGPWPGQLPLRHRPVKPTDQSNLLTSQRMMSAWPKLPDQARIRGFDANWDTRLGVFDVGEQGKSNDAGSAAVWSSEHHRRCLRAAVNDDGQCRSATDRYGGNRWHGEEQKLTTKL
jgi:hypothetical protein